MMIITIFYLNLQNTEKLLNNNYQPQPYYALTVNLKIPKELQLHLKRFIQRYSAYLV